MIKTNATWRDTFGVLIAGLLIAFAVRAHAEWAAYTEKKIRDSFAAITKAFHDRDAVGGVSPYVKDDTLVLFDLIPSLPQTSYAGALNSAHATINGTREAGARSAI